MNLENTIYSVNALNGSIVTEDKKEIGHAHNPEINFYCEEGSYTNNVEGEFTPFQCMGCEKTEFIKRNEKLYCKQCDTYICEIRQFPDNNNN